MEREPDKITRQIIDWQKNGNGFSEIIKDVSELVIDYPGKWYGWNRDKCTDFYLSFYPLILRLITIFEYQGKSFKALLRNTIKMQMKTYHRKTCTYDNIDYCLRYNAIIEAEEACDVNTRSELMPTSYAVDILGINEAGEICSKRLKTGLVILTLKNIHYIDDNYINKVAELTGYAVPFLTEAVIRLRDKCCNKRERFNICQSRSNKAYLNLCQIHRELDNCSNFIERDNLVARLDSFKSRQKKARLGKDHISMAPTNSDIAEVMKLPKGSVDSNLYFLKKILKNLPSPDDAEARTF